MNPDPTRFTALAAEAINEANHSIRKHGEQRHVPMGTGPNSQPLLFARTGIPGGAHVDHDTALRLELNARVTTDMHAAVGEVTWMDILTEEVFEAYAAATPTELRAELVQVAAVALKMIDALDHTHPTTEEGRIWLTAEERHHA